MLSINTLTIGAPHIRSKIKHARNNNYTLSVSLNELLDFPVQKCSQIHIKIYLDAHASAVGRDDEAVGKLYKLTISDNCKNGFENILSSGLDNPLNFGHERKGHNDDKEISEYGTGMKQALAATGNKITIITKLLNNKIYKIVMDFVEMSSRDNVIDSYSPTNFFEISDDEYRSYHEYDYGSTIIIEEIHKESYNTTTASAIEKEIIDNISKTYSKLLKKNQVKIKVNKSIVQGYENYFERKECKPFNEKRELIIKKENETAIVVEKNGDKYRKFKNSTGNFSGITKKQATELFTLPNYYSSGYLDTDTCHIMVEIKGTGLQFIPKSEILQENLPKGHLNIYKLDRYHGKYIHEATNGARNYVYNEMIIRSKQLGKDIGSNYNKTISLNSNNDIKIESQKRINRDLSE